jgi:hypothetical protein
MPHTNNSKTYSSLTGGELSVKAADEFERVLFKGINYLEK